MSKHTLIKILIQKYTIFPHTTEREYNHELNRKKNTTNTIKDLVYNTFNTKKSERPIRIMWNGENFEDLYVTKKSDEISMLCDRVLLYLDASDSRIIYFDFI